MASFLGDVSAFGRALYFRARFLIDFNKNVAQMDVPHPETPAAPKKTGKYRPGCLFPVQTALKPSVEEPPRRR